MKTPEREMFEHDCAPSTNAKFLIALGQRKTDKRRTVLDMPGKIIIALQLPLT